MLEIPDFWSHCVQVVLYWGSVKAGGSWLLWSSVETFPAEASKKERGMCVHERCVPMRLGCTHVHSSSRTGRTDKPLEAPFEGSQSKEIIRFGPRRKSIRLIV